MTGEASWLTLVLPLAPFFLVLGSYWWFTSRALHRVHHAHR